MKERFLELVAAFGLLTRLPVWRLAPNATPARYAQSIWAYPLVGGVIGGIGASAYALALRIGLSPMLAAIWTIATLLLVTGGLHEDGLADTADGFGGGSTPERRREIMRDSRIGSYGALALIVTLAIRTIALAALASPAQAATALIVAGAVSRAAILIVLLASRPARTDGLAAGLGAIPPLAATTGLICALLIAVTVLPSAKALLLSVIAAGLGLAMARLATRQIGGHTGDVLGAVAVGTEAVILSLLTL